MGFDPQPNEANGANGALQRFMAGRGPLALLVVLIVVSLVLICMMGALLLRSFGGDAPAAGPTPFPDAAQPPAGMDALVMGMSDSTTVSVTLDIPTTLLLKGRQFAVQTQSIAADGIWSPNLESETTAVWIYGTIINYVLGLPAGAANRTLLESLAPGDAITLSTRGGHSIQFVFDSRRQAQTTDRNVFSQLSPGITLILLGNGDGERLVVNGRYVVDESTTGVSAGRVELGETAQLVDTQITVTGATYVPNRPEAPPGFAFYLVDFQIQNVGLTAVDANRLQFVLSDELGNQYARNPVASQLGNYPPLTGFLNAGQSATATAGYQIPAGLVSSALRWTVERTDVGAQVQVVIPFNAGSRGGQGAVITLESAAIAPDLTSLVLRGQITNLDSQPLVIAEGDISLRTADGSSYLLLSTNPAFPWAAPPGQSLPFAVTFQRPNAPTAVFTVLNQPFELSNLR